MGFIDVIEADDVTDEVREHAKSIYNAFFFTQTRIDWDRFFDKLERRVLDDGSEINLGEFSDSPAIREIREYIKALHTQDLEK